MMGLEVRAVRFMNEIAILGLLFICVSASILQFMYHELPCPLCLLQRLGLLSMSFGLLLNLRYGFKPSHYAISIFAALYTLVTSGTQELMHILPGSSTYAQPIMGLGLYTWAFIISFLFILFCLFLLIWNRQYEPGNMAIVKGLHMHRTRILFLMIILIAFFNIATTFILCGIQKCPSNPTEYRILHKYME